MTSRRIALLVVVTATLGLAVYLSGRDTETAAAPGGAVPTTTTAAPAAITTPTASPATSSTRPSSSAPSGSAADTSSAAPVTAPPLRQRPQLYPAPGTDPSTVAVVAAPADAPTAAELATPTGAGAAWAARWCPFTHLKALGTAESRAQAVMTPAGWASFDPRTDPVAVGAWAGVTAAGLTGTCSAPDVGISPEAPSSPTATYVTVTLTRVVTSTTGPTTVETVTDTRLVVLADGRWLVDTAAQAG